MVILTKADKKFKFVFEMAMDVSVSITKVNLVSLLVLDSLSNTDFLLASVQSAWAGIHSPRLPTTLLVISQLSELSRTKLQIIVLLNKNGQIFCAQTSRSGYCVLRNMVHSLLELSF